MTPSALKKQFESDFFHSGIETPAVDAALLIEELCGISKLEILLNPAQELSSAAEARLRAAALRRCRREPLQYITGKACFRNLELKVTPDVLIPRPETELLVDEIIRELPPGGTLLDIGTGSGAIAVSAADERRDIRVTAVDISPQALEVAKENARRAGVEICFLQSDLFSALEGKRFDYIAANLPYVTDEEYLTLAPEVREHEPRLALTAPESGFALIRKTAEKLKDHLTPAGKAGFELDPQQAARLQKLLTDSGFAARILKDLTGRERFVLAKQK